MKFRHQSPDSITTLSLFSTLFWFDESFNSLKKKLKKKNPVNSLQLITLKMLLGLIKLKKPELTLKWTNACRQVVVVHHWVSGLFYLCMSDKSCFLDLFSRGDYWCKIMYPQPNPMVLPLSGFLNHYYHGFAFCTLKMIFFFFYFFLHDISWFLLFSLNKILICGSM